MAKDKQKFLKAIEKFRKNSEKEIDRVRSLQKKAGKMQGFAETSPSARQFLDRLTQKELQLSGEIAWADGLAKEAKASGGQAEKKASGPVAVR